MAVSVPSSPFSWRYAGLLAIALSCAISCGDDPVDPPMAGGGLQVTISGLPDTIEAGVTVTGPAGYSATIRNSASLPRLLPGVYTIAVTRVVTSVATFVPAFESLDVTVGVNAVSQVAIIYSVTTGSISMVVAGIPPDVPGQVTIAGPGGFRDSVSASRTLGNLAPGIYTVSAGEAIRGLSIYAPRTAEFVLTVSPSLTPVRATVEYRLVTGTLSLNVHGLPPGLDASFSVSGPAGFATTGTGSVVLEGLRQGRYTIAASTVGSDAALRNVTPATQSVAVIAGAVAVANVSYWAAQPPPGLNLTIDAVQVQQVVQSYGGAVPTIAGRDALLRVFVRASEPNAQRPAVRVRLYDGLQLIATNTIPAPGGAVPTAMDEGTLAASWNLNLPATMVRPGLRVLADADPANAISETSESDNSWPSSGAPLALDVRTVPPLAVRIVPVTISASGLTGGVNAGNIGLYEAAARQLLPLESLTTELRPVFTSGAPPLQPNDANGAWVQVLSEINALRAAEGSQAHYYGVVKVPYAAGVVGLSYLPSFAAIGHDALPDATSTFVHELGHQFGRLHAPACGAGGFDANYPYAGGTIGAYGFDAATLALLPPATPDIMGYCDTSWISDYTFTGVLAYRAAQVQSAASAPGGSRQRGLLIWGRIGPGGVVLEPAFDVDAPARLPHERGPHRLEILDDSGRVAWSAAFRGEATVDAPSNEEHFAFVVPVASLGERPASRIRLVTAGRRVELSARDSPIAADDFSAVARRVSATKLTLTWRAGAARGVLVRDARTGAVLALGRSGKLDLITSGRELDLTFSDGVRSLRQSIVAR